VDCQSGYGDQGDQKKGRATARGARRLVTAAATRRFRSCSDAATAHGGERHEAGAPPYQRGGLGDGGVSSQMFRPS
jgi:hypothetical protein